MTEFRKLDTKRPDGCYVHFRRVLRDDYDASPTDDLFQDEAYRDEDQKRLDAFTAGEWCFVGVQAIADVLVVRDGIGTMHTLRSAGLWGVESDCGEEYLSEVYEEEKAALRADLNAMGNLIVED